MISCLWGKFLSSSRSYLRKRICIRRVVWGCTVVTLVLTYENGFVFVGRFEDVLSVLTKTDEWHMYHTVITLIWYLLKRMSGTCTVLSSRSYLRKRMSGMYLLPCTVIPLVITKTDERYSLRQRWAARCVYAGKPVTIGFVAAHILG